MDDQRDYAEEQWQQDEMRREAEAEEYWSGFGSCRICKAEAGDACVALNGRVAGGRPDGVVEVLRTAHASRYELKGRRDGAASHHAQRR